MGERWSEQRVWDWYNSRPWMRGCNYMSADCANRIDQWQSLGFEERMQTTEEELALMEKTGFNSIRIILEFVVWRDEHDSFRPVSGAMCGTRNLLHGDSGQRLHAS